MLKKLFGASKHEMEPDPRPWDDDPVAQKTDWSPKSGGGASFQTHALAPCSAARVEFRMTRGARMFCMLFVAAGAAVPGMAFYSSSQTGSSDTTGAFVVAIVGLVFLGAGFGMLHFMGMPRVFDKLSGRYWKGRKDPQMTMPSLEPEDGVALAEIYALQLLVEHVRGNKSSYYSYELNLVLQNGRRINVIDHGNVGQLREDARELSRFLDVPVWDAA